MFIKTVSRINIFSAPCCYWGGKKNTQKTSKLGRWKNWFMAGGSVCFLDVCFAAPFCSPGLGGKWEEDGKACAEKTKTVVGSGCPVPLLPERLSLVVEGQCGSLCALSLAFQPESRAVRAVSIAHVCALTALLMHGHTPSLKTSSTSRKGSAKSRFLSCVPCCRASRHLHFMLQVWSIDHSRSPSSGGAHGAVIACLVASDKQSASVW